MAGGRRPALVTGVFLVALLAMASTAAAGPIVSFGPPTTTALPQNSAQVDVGDFNQDGDPDLAIANDASGNVSIMVGGAGGSFSGPTNIAVPGGATSVGVASLNPDQDSDPDLVVVGTSGTVSVLLGAAGATFTAGQTMTAGSFPVFAAAGDLNADGDPELVVVNQGSDDISIFTAGQGGSFGAVPLNITVGDAPGGVVIGNFNSTVDSDPDLAVTNHGQQSSPAADTVSVLTGTGGAAIGFSAPVNVTVGDYPDSLVRGDFNQDGDPDLAVVNSGSGTGGPFTVSILTGGAGTTFAVTSTLTGGSQGISIGDFNVDGDPDLVAAGTFGNNLAVFVGSTGATFLAAQTFTAAGQVSSTAVGDFNQDSRPDIAAARYSPPASITTVLNTSDLVPPNTTIDTGPSGLTNDNTPTFTSSSSEGGPNFECQIDNLGFNPCSSSFTTGTLSEGAHTIQIRAVDAGGNVDASPAVRNITVDTVPPVTAIDSGPTGLTNDNTPMFTFSGGATFVCRLDGTGSFAPCSSPHTTAQLGDGPHTFEVIAIDAAGNADPTAATRNFTVDAATPETTITSGPSGPTNDNTPTFGFAASEAGTFECRVDDGDFVPCSTGLTLDTLPDGDHTFEVQATDTVGNLDPSAAIRSFRVDTVAPETTIASGPSGIITSSRATFVFNSSEPGSRFQCRLDLGAFAPCASPYTTPPLRDGVHTFEVRAIDAAGNVDPSAASTFNANASTRTFLVYTAVVGTPAPVLGRTFNVVPIKGTVLVSVPGSGARASATVPGIKGRNFVPLQQARQIPVGSMLDTRRGTVRITSARDTRGTVQTADFSSGVFQVLQSRSTRARGLTDLVLKGSSFRRCRVRGSSLPVSASRLSRRAIRKLRGRGKGRFRTRGRYSAATVRGTDWTVIDRCDGTLTRVKRGRVAVRDKRRRKTVVLRAGKRYLARARGR